MVKSAMSKVKLAIIGLKGSGKSTACRFIKEILEHKDKKVQVIKPPLQTGINNIFALKEFLHQQQQHDLDFLLIDDDSCDKKKYRIYQEFGFKIIRVDCEHKVRIERLKANGYADENGKVILVDENLINLQDEFVIENSKNCLYSLLSAIDELLKKSIEKGEKNGN